MVHEKEELGVCVFVCVHTVSLNAEVKVKSKHARAERTISSKERGRQPSGKKVQRTGGVTSGSVF